MGIFSQDKTTTNQTDYNQQVGLSNRDLSGQQITGGGGTTGGVGGQVGVGAGSNSNFGNGLILGNSSGNNITYQNVDATVLHDAASAITAAVSSNEETTKGLLQGFQNSTGVSGESQSQAGYQPPNALTNPVNSTGATPIIGGIISQHDLFLFGAAAALGIILFFGYRKFHR